MKKLSDLIQVVMLDGGWLSILIWMVIIVFTWQVFKIVKMLFVLTIQVVKKSHISFGKNKSQIIATIFFVFSAAMILNALRGPIVNQIQYIEQAYLSPVYINTDTSTWTIQAYENELKRHVGESEFEIIKNETRKTAAAIGCSPLAIYEVAYSECGLNPFAANVNERGDTVAFGWIQFTSAGCLGTNVDGREITMREVKSWGRTRNLLAMMEATRSYLVKRKGTNDLFDAVEVYTAVFAPGMIGLQEDAVLYSVSGSFPKAYWQNVCLDGYGEENGKILHCEKYRDGKITKKDMRLHLSLKKSLFLKKEL